MVSANTLCKKLLNVKSMVVKGLNLYLDRSDVHHLTIEARPNKWHLNDCPYCHRKCPRYDKQSDKPRTWRSLDFAGVLVDVVYPTHRICCPEHGVLVADVPWAFPNSHFTKDFDMTVAWLAKYLPRSAVASYMRIDWKTVGNCISRAREFLEPDMTRRLDGLVHIGIDETSYKKGHKYITVIINHDTNEVVWASQGHGKEVLKRFFLQLTDKQRSSIEVVTGDGARWITSCVNDFLPGADRCVDNFHVVEWAMEALDEVRREVWREAHAEVESLKKANPRSVGRPKADDPISKEINDAKERADDLKGLTYALGKAPENLTENQRAKVDMVAITNDKLYRAYQLKEKLRLILKLKDVDEAASELDRWLWWASHSRIDSFKELYKKIKRHREHILNSIRLGMNNARLEATNNKIKLIIRKAYGFRNINNMLDMIYLVCSKIDIPLPNRKPKQQEAT